MRKDLGTREQESALLGAALSGNYPELIDLIRKEDFVQPEYASIADMIAVAARDKLPITTETIANLLDSIWMGWVIDPLRQIDTQDVQDLQGEVVRDFMGA